MPNYILSRTSPPAHIYERKINLGYGIKVDVSDAPTQTQKGKEMNAKEVLDVADKQVDNVDAKPVNTAAFADGTTFTGNEERTRADPDTHPAEKVAPPEGESNNGLAFNGI